MCVCEGVGVRARAHPHTRTVCVYSKLKYRRCTHLFLLGGRYVVARRTHVHFLAINFFGRLCTGTGPLLSDEGVESALVEQRFSLCIADADPRCLAHCRPRLLVAFTPLLLGAASSQCRGLDGGGFVRAW